MGRSVHYTPCEEGVDGGLWSPDPGSVLGHQHCHVRARVAFVGVCVALLLVVILLLLLSLLLLPFLLRLCSF